MRQVTRNGSFTVQAIAGSYVVLLGIDMAEASTQGLLGFAIERIDKTEGEHYWLQGQKTFAETDPGLPAGTPVSTLQHPVQGFLWQDFTAKPGHEYTYRIVAMRGKPKGLEQGEVVEVDVKTEEVDTGTHAIWFNRGVAASQAYARKFGNQQPDQVPNNAAWNWLSRGLVEALLAFIGQAADASFSLRGALYEFQYQPVLAAFGAARDRGADVKLVVDERANSTSTPRTENQKAISAAHIDDLVLPRTTNPAYIAHNKFIVLLKDGKPTQVWTGSTNITDGGIFGHSNVGHLVRDPDVASIYLDAWERLSKDPQAPQLRKDNQAATPLPAGLTPKDSVTPVFSPRPDLGALEWYRDRMDQAGTGVFFTAAFGVNDLFDAVLSEPRDYLRYVLLESDDAKLEGLDNPNNRIAFGSVLGDNAFERWLKEKTTNLNVHVRYIHTKYMLIDPLGDDPIVITGSANFSDASTRNNDENMLVIRGNKVVADIYLGEFMRLFKHYQYRDFIANQSQGTDPNAGGPGQPHLAPNDSWAKESFMDGTVQQKERQLFAGR
jgi:phosphatidylserine/phosphatidylglycerophosphate/cardiolipin synthase-like enzyme